LYTFNSFSHTKLKEHGIQKHALISVLNAIKLAFKLYQSQSHLSVLH